MTVGSGTQLIALLGVSMMDSRIGELLGEMDVARPEYITDRDCYASERGHGLDILFKPARALLNWEQFGVAGDAPVTSAFFLHSEGFEGYRQYRGELPHGLTFDLTVKQTRALLDPLGTPKTGCFARWDFERHYCTVDFTPEGRISLVTVGLFSGPPITRRPLTEEQRAAQPDLLRVPSYDAVPQGLAEFRDALEALPRPSIGLGLAGTTGPLPPLTSKMGGCPDLPPDMAWPTGEGDAPLPLMVQLNLTELAERFPDRLPWPTGGGLIQLFTTGDEMDMRVLVHRELVDFRTAEAVDVQVDFERRLEPVETLCLVDLPECGPASESLEEVRDRLDEDQLSALEEWLEQYWPERLQVGGCAQWQQDPGYWEAWNLDRGGDRWELGEVEYDKERYSSPWAYAEQRAIADGWQLVAQFRDDGTFYLLAPLDVTGRWDLDRLQVVYQCT